MTAAPSFLRGASTLMAGHAGAQILGLIRNLLIARLVAPEDFGVAAAFAALLSILDGISDMAWDKLIIQAKDGDDASLMASVHSLNLLRGLLLAIALFLNAEYLANLFGVPEAQNAFAWLALVPLVRGLCHMDPKRFQRDMSFGPEISVSLGSHLLGLIIAVITALWLGDYRAMLCGLVAQALGQTVMTQLFAERRYHLGWSVPRLQQIFTFGWPLLFNGMVIALASQGDRLLVGAQLGMRDLALYAATAMLVNAAGILLLRMLNGVGLPWLARHQEDQDEFTRRYRLFGAAVAGISMLTFIPMILLGTEIVALIFGQDFRAPALLMGWLAFGYCLRLLKAWPVITSLALGDTKNVLIGNIVRPVGLMAALFVLHQGGSLVAVAAAMVLGEVVALLASLWRLGIISKLPVLRDLAPLVLTTALSAFAVGILWAASDTIGLLMGLVYTLALTLVGSLLVILTSPPLRHFIRNEAGKRLKRA